MPWFSARSVFRLYTDGAGFQADRDCSACVSCAVGDFPAANSSFCTWLPGCPDWVLWAGVSAQTHFLFRARPWGVRPAPGVPALPPGSPAPAPGSSLGLFLTQEPVSWVPLGSLSVSALIFLV